MKSRYEVKLEIASLKKLAVQYHDDAAAQASIAGQINALSWVLRGESDAFEKGTLEEGGFRQHS